MFWYGVVFLFTIGQIFSFAIDAGSGIAGTTLTAAIAADDRYIPIASAGGFLDSDERVFLRGEELSYESIKTADADCGEFDAPCLDTGEDAAGRGINGTKASTHPTGSKVMTEGPGLLNEVVTFRVGSIDSAFGIITFPFKAAGALLKFLAKMVIWDFAFLSGNGVYLKFILLYPLSAAAVLAFLKMSTDAISRFTGR